MKGTGKPMLSINGLRAGVVRTILRFFDHGATFTASGLVDSDGLHLTR